MTVSVAGTAILAGAAPSAILAVAKMTVCQNGKVRKKGIKLLTTQANVDRIGIAKGESYAGRTEKKTTKIL